MSPHLLTVRTAFLTFALNFYLASYAQPQALDLVDASWGFDGKVLPGQFNLLTLTVVNRSPAPFDAALTLRERDTFSGQPQRLRHPVYLAPGQQQLIRLYPFIPNDNSSWSLSWPGQRDAIALPDPPAGDPATVFVHSSADLSPPNAQLPSLPDLLFPPSTIGMGSLHALVLAHDPAWQDAQRRAFMAWLEAGGTLHIFPDATAGRPQFTGAMAPLNQPADAFSLALGHVRYHRDSPASSASLDRLAATSPPCPPTPRLARGESVHVMDPTGQLTGQLGAVVSPKIRWGLIYLLAFLYLGLVGPAHIIWGRARRSFLTSLGAFLAIVAVFSYAFLLVGRRGYDEKTIVHSLSHARLTSSGTWDVHQWATAFVTRGATYTFTYPAARVAFATSSSGSSGPPPLIEASPPGSLTADIPLFSSTGFFARFSQQGPSFDFKLASWQERRRPDTSQPTLIKDQDAEISLNPSRGEERYLHLELELVGELPPGTSQAFLLYEGSFYDMLINRSSEATSLVSGQRRPDLSLGAHDPYSQFVPPFFSGGDRSEPPDQRATRIYAAALPILLNHAALSTPGFEFTIDRPPPQGSARATLFLLAPTPPSFLPTGDLEGLAEGQTIFAIDLLKPAP